MSAHLCEQCGYVHMSEGALRGQKRVGFRFLGTGIAEGWEPMPWDDAAHM